MKSIELGKALADGTQLTRDQTTQSIGRDVMLSGYNWSLTESDTRNQTVQSIDRLIEYD